MYIPNEVEQLLGPMEQGSVVTDDGVELFYQSFGQGPPIVFGNGIGVRYPGAARQVAALRRDYRIICWDYRGIGLSQLPHERCDLSMPRHARDILTILDHLRLPQALFVGWSMGVQVALEVIRQRPGAVAGFVALLGTHGRPFQTAFPAIVARGIEGFFTVLNKLPRLAQAPLDLATALPRVAFFVLSHGFFVGRDADQAVFRANVSSVADVEKSIYTRTMLELAQHEAFDILSQVRCPSLIIAAQRDYLTPISVAKLMAQTIPQATYREIVGGTHFALIEQADLVNDWLAAFAAEVYVSESSVQAGAEP